MKKKLIIGISIFILFLIICIFVTPFIINFKLVGDDEVTINANHKYYDSGYKATLFGKEYKNVKVTDNIDNLKLGDYEVKYTVRFLFGFRTLKRTIHVVDEESPTISLDGSETIFIGKSQSYEEPGFKAEDNLDGDITDKVEVENNIDVNTAGEYVITYKVKDSSGNETSVTRNVQVQNNDFLNSSIAEFNLTGFYSKVTLVPQEQEYDYFKDVVILGDSNIRRLSNVISKNQIWGHDNLYIKEINHSTFEFQDNNQTVTFEQAMNARKPKYLIITPGIQAGLYMPINTYKEELQLFIDNMRNKYPDTKFYFLSILPINTGTIPRWEQKDINIRNYYLAEICNQNNVPFINFADSVKDSEGYAAEEYFNCSTELDCGFHLNQVGREKLIDYIKHLDLEKEI